MNPNLNFKYSIIYLFITIITPNYLYAQKISHLPISSIRSNITPMVFGEKIKLAGGNYSQKIDIIDTENNTTTSATNVPFFQKTSVVQKGDLAVHYNLFGVNLSSTSLLVYDNVRNSWKNVYSSSLLNNRFQAFEDDNYIHLPPKENSSTTYLKLNLNTLYFEVASRKVGQSNMEHVDVEDKVFFLGGTNVDYYDKTDNSWHPNVAKLNQNRINFKTIFNDNKIYLIGGYSLNSNVITYANTVEIFDITDLSTSVINLSVKRDKVCGTIVNNKLLVGGGTSKIIEIVDLTTKTVDVYHTGAQYDLTAMTCGRVGNLAVFAGGNSYDSDEVFIYNSICNTWSIFKFDEIRSQITFVEHNNKLYLAGGGSNLEKGILVIEDNLPWKDKYFTISSGNWSNNIIWMKSEYCGNRFVSEAPINTELGIDILNNVLLDQDIEIGNLKIKGNLDVNNFNIIIKN